MNINPLPPRPKMPKYDPNGDPEVYQRKMLEYKEAQGLYMAALQAEQDRISEETGIRSAMQKSAHDAMEAIIRNLA